MAYSPTVKLQQQESSRGRDERTAHSYDDIAAATKANLTAAQREAMQEREAELLWGN